MSKACCEYCRTATALPIYKELVTLYENMVEGDISPVEEQMIVNAIEAAEGEEGSEAVAEMIRATISLCRDFMKFIRVLETRHDQLRALEQGKIKFEEVSEASHD